MNRKVYAYVISSVFIVFFFLFGLLALIANGMFDIPLPAFWCFILYGLMGGWLIGGIISGILLFAAFIKSRSTFLKVLSAVLFPITYICIMYVGILAGIPYYVYNMVKLNKGGDEVIVKELADGLAFSYIRGKKQISLTGSILFAAVLLIFIPVFFNQQRYLLFGFLTIFSFLIMYLACGYVDYVRYQKIHNILVAECDPKRYVQVMKDLLVMKQPDKLRTKYNLQLLLCRILLGEELEDTKFLDQNNNYQLYNRTYAIAKICFLLKKDDEESQICELLQKVPGINRNILDVAILNKHKEYQKADDLACELLNKTDLRLSNIQKVYLHYLRMQICTALCRFEQAEYEKNYVLQNGNTLGIRKECKTI